MRSIERVSNEMHDKILDTYMFYTTGGRPCACTYSMMTFCHLPVVPSCPFRRPTAGEQVFHQDPYLRLQCVKHA